jgi:intracellular sulfur oxidation DsrE/DsrF family protein
MKKIIIALAIILTGGGIAYAVLAHSMVYPVIKSFGPVYEVSFAVEKPDTSMEYKIVADCGEVKDKPIEKPGDVYAPLQQISRMYNLHVYGGVQQKNLNVAVVIWGDPISIIMNNEAYRKKHGVDNPNLKIIGEMKQAGITFYACSQSMIKYGVDPVDVNRDITIALSRFTAVSTMQLKGYAYFKF